MEAVTSRSLKALSQHECPVTFSGSPCAPSPTSDAPHAPNNSFMPAFDLELGPAYLVTLAITSAIYLVLVFSIRLFLRLKVNGPFGRDDWACLASTLCGLVYSVIVVVQVFMGLGFRQRQLSATRMEALKIIGWINAFFLTMAGFFSKISACYLLARITRTREHLAVAYGLMAAMVMWMLQAQISTLVQCDYPRPWDTSPRKTCHDRVKESSPSTSSNNPSIKQPH